MARTPPVLFASSTSSSLPLFFTCSRASPRSRPVVSASTRCRHPPSSLLLFSRRSKIHGAGFRLRYRFSADDHPEDPLGGEENEFERAVSLFNGGDYYGCHDLLEEMWYAAEEPTRTLIHGILQCAVGLHHLFNQNHRGAMMELGEGLCKLRKMDFDDGPFLVFEREVSEALEFVYQTQKELAACTDELCVAMDGSERSYQLLGSFAAGQPLYNSERDSSDGVSYITFNPGSRYLVQRPPRAKLPTLQATDENMKVL